MTKANKIVYFQSEWALQIHTLEILNALSECGYEVIFFLNSCSEKFIDLDSDLSKSVKVYKFEQKKFHQKNRLLRFIFSRLSNKFISFEMILFVLKHTEFKVKYNFIGIEKLGLIWAIMAKRFRHATVIYHSLELYLDNPGTHTDKEFDELRLIEKKCHNLAEGLIIQDEKREFILVTGNEADKRKTLLFPIMLRSKTFFSSSIVPGCFQVIYFGVIRPQRFSHKLIEIVHAFPTNCLLKIHGPNDGGIVFLNKGLNNLKISNNNLSQQLIDDLIKNSHIGLCLYDNDKINDRLTANSSEKLVRYLRSGLPIIAFSNESYVALQMKYYCCELIYDIHELPNALKLITNNYFYYKKNALSAFDALYNINVRIKEYKDFIDNF